jgi:hypothetical protein
MNFTWKEYNFSMKKIIILTLLLMVFGNAQTYRLIYLKAGGTLNVRDSSFINSSKVVGRIPAYATDIRVNHCKINTDGNEWCYISYPIGGSHLEGWVNAYYLSPVEDSPLSEAHIKNFLMNYYLADQEDFLDKLETFYAFPLQQYFANKTISKMQLRSLKVNEYKRWPKRSYLLTYMKILKRHVNYIDVQTTVRWNLKNREDAQSGRDIQKLRLVPTGDQFQVLAIKNLKREIFPKPEIPQELNVTTPENNVSRINNESNVSKEPLYYIKVGSFFGEIQPSYFAKITASGFHYMVKKEKIDNSVVQRVYIGPYESTMQTVEALALVREKINQSAYIQTLVP